MALSIATVWECRASGASDNSGGGYAPLTVSTFSGTDLVVDATVNTKVTSASHNFVAADVGGRIFITAGAGWTPGFYTISSVAANAANLSASPAPTGTTGGTWALTGQDRSQQNSAQVAINNSSITTSITANVITFTAGYTPTVADVGNVVQMLTGTNVTAGFYQITAFTSTTWTVTGAASLPTSGTTTNATGNMGGALATLSKLSGAMVASNKAFVTGAFTSSATNTFAQTVATPSAAAPYTTLVGYGSTRGDSTHATLTLQTNTGLTGISLGTSAGFDIRQIDVDCGSLGTSTAINLGSGSWNRAARCKVANFTTAGIIATGVDVSITYCEGTGGGAAATAAISSSGNPTFIENCHAHDNACDGIIAGEGMIAFCMVVNNSGASSDGIQCSWGARIVNNTIHNNGRDGIRMLSDIRVPSIILNNIFSSNAGFGLNNSSGNPLPAREVYDGNAYFNNTSGARNGYDSTSGIFGISPYTNVRDVTLTGSPFIGPTTGSTANFSLNNLSGAGAACRGTGTPMTWGGNTGTTGFLDMGAVQVQAPGFTGIIVPT